MGSAYSKLQNWGNDFHDNLDEDDVVEINRAKWIFLVNSFLPGFIYYLGYGIDGKRVKFPATIS